MRWRGPAQQAHAEWGSCPQGKCNALRRTYCGTQFPSVQRPVSGTGVLGKKTPGGFGEPTRQNRGCTRSVKDKKQQEDSVAINDSLGIDTQSAWPKKPFHWFKLCAGDILKGTMDMKADEFGAHVLLLIHYWSHGRLPETDDECAFVARMEKRRWRASRQKILARVAAECSQDARHRDDDEDEPNKLSLSAQRAAMLKLSKERAEFGRKGGRPKGERPRLVASNESAFAS